MRDRKLRHEAIRWEPAVHSSGLGLDCDILLMGGSELPKRLTIHAWYHILLRAVIFEHMSDTVGFWEWGYKSFNRNWGTVGSRGPWKGWTQLHEFSSADWNFSLRRCLIFFYFRRKTSFKQACCLFFFNEEIISRIDDSKLLWCTDHHGSSLCCA